MTQLVNGKTLSNSKRYLVSSLLVVSFFTFLILGMMNSKSVYAADCLTDPNMCNKGAGVAAIKDGLLSIEDVKVIGQLVSGSKVQFEVVGHTVWGDYFDNKNVQKWDQFEISSSNSNDQVLEDNSLKLSDKVSDSGARTVQIKYNNGFDELSKTISIQVLAESNVGCLDGDNLCNNNSKKDDSPNSLINNPLAITGIAISIMFLLTSCILLFAIVIRRRDDDEK